MEEAKVNLILANQALIMLALSIILCETDRNFEAKKEVQDQLVAYTEATAKMLGIDPNNTEEEKQ